MKARIIRQAFAEANAAVKGVVGKDALSVFANVRLDVSGDNVSLTGTNGDMQLEWRLKGECGENGTVTVPGMRLAAFASAMPDGTVTIETVAVDKLKIAGGEGVTFRLAAGEGDKYAAMIGPKEGAVVATLPAVTFREMLRKVKFAASDDLKRPNLCGVNMRLHDDVLDMTATDGRRLAHIEFEIREAADDGFDVTLANKAVGVLFGLLAKVDEGDVYISSDGKSVRIMCSSWCLTAKVIDGVYPSWKKVVPGRPQYRAEIGRVEFLAALERAALASDGDSPSVKVSVAPGLVAFEARGEFADAKTATDKCKIAVADAKESWHFNPRLLKDALESIDEDDFALEFGWGGAHGPVILKCSVPWFVVIMPLQKY